MDLPRYNVLGVGIHAVNLASATDYIVSAAQSKRSGYVCCCDAHSISQARRFPAHRHTLNTALLATPDGMPLVWTGQRSGHLGVGRTYGPDLIQSICAASAETSLSHYLYGGTEGVADALAQRLTHKFPGLSIAGAETPDWVEDVSRLPTQRIIAANPDFVWVGLSTPKQEAFMHHLHTTAGLTGISLGVGAAFDFLTDRVTQAPQWVQRSGGEWLWRMAQEPRRLVPRYCGMLPLFALRLLAQRTGIKRYPLD